MVRSPPPARPTDRLLMAGPAQPATGSASASIRNRRGRCRLSRISTCSPRRRHRGRVRVGARIRVGGLHPRRLRGPRAGVGALACPGELLSSGERGRFVSRDGLSREEEEEPPASVRRPVHPAASTARAQTPARNRCPPQPSPFLPGPAAPLSYRVWPARSTSCYVLRPLPWGRGQAGHSPAGEGAVPLKPHPVTPAHSRPTLSPGPRVGNDLGSRHRARSTRRLHYDLNTRTGCESAPRTCRSRRSPGSTLVFPDRAEPSARRGRRPAAVPRSAPRHQPPSPGRR